MPMSVDGYAALEADSHATERAARFAGYRSSRGQFIGNGHCRGNRDAMRDMGQTAINLEGNEQKGNSTLNGTRALRRVRSDTGQPHLTELKSVR